MATAAEYVDWGKQAITALLDREHALVVPEIFAKASERIPPGSPTSIDPHHILTARADLMHEERVRDRTATTKGQRPVTVMVPSETGGRLRAIQDASARKRLLYGRYLGWASGTPSQASLTGPAAENVVHKSLQEAAGTVGYQLENPAYGQTSEFLGETVPFGPLDNAARFFDYSTDEAFAIPVEVKNLRDWIYPTSPELHQLLAKAAGLHAARADVSIVPVLVCRRAQRTAFRFAKDLGFHIIDLRRQFIRPGPFQSEEKQQLLNEVRTELGFLDLSTSDGPERRAVHQFEAVLPRVARDTSLRWSRYGSRFRAAFEEMRSDPPLPRRQELIRAIREAMRGEPDPTTGIPRIERGW